MNPQNLTLGIAFLAGLLSFVSPCVLPLVPAYIGYLGGTTVIVAEQRETGNETSRIFLHSLLFVLGFSLVFVLLGASASFLGRLLFDYSGLVQRVGGVLLVVFGMRLMGIGWSRRRWIAAALLAAIATFLLSSGWLIQGGIDFGQYALGWLADGLIIGLVVLAGADWGAARQVILAVGAGSLNFVARYDFEALVPNLVTSMLIALIAFFFNRAGFFYAEKKFELDHGEQTGYLRSLIFGVVFAAGWTPCIGPILAGILVVASQLETVGQGVLLLLAYSLGLGLPFLVVGLAFGPLSKTLRRMNRYLGVVSVVSGVLLVIMGMLIFTNSLTFLSQYGDFFEIEL
jgi:cytochrome c-type biogenesis protein